MLALGIILVLLILLLILPVGADARYDGTPQVKLKIGALKFTVLPAKTKKDRPKKEKKAKRKEKQKLSVQDVLDLARIGLKALGRVRRSLSVDLFRLHILVSADDPFDAVIRYGALNAGLGTLAPLLHRALKIRREDVRTNVDVQGGEGSIFLQITATLQVWEILWIALCGGYAFLSWRRARRKAAKSDETINENTQEEKAS